MSLFLFDFLLGNVLHFHVVVHIDTWWIWVRRQAFEVFHMEPDMMFVKKESTHSSDCLCFWQRLWGKKGWSKAAARERAQGWRWLLVCDWWFVYISQVYHFTFLFCIQKPFNIHRFSLTQEGFLFFFPIIEHLRHNIGHTLSSSCSQMRSLTGYSSQVSSDLAWHLWNSGNQMLTRW